MKFNRQSNAYIIIYIIVLVVLVGALLAYTSMSLKPLQQANINADKMKQILASVHIVPDKDASIQQTFDKYVIEQFVVSSDGSRIPDTDAFSLDVAKQIKRPADARELPVYMARLDNGDVKYILPAYGAGLWGPIWGYIAVDSNGSTIYGAYFSHQGETPGLGAEIEKPAFSSQFEGKNLFKNGTFIPVEVIKIGQKPSAGADYVDAISGGTITSKGVAAMLDNCLRPYREFLGALADNTDSAN